MTTAAATAAAGCVVLVLAGCAQTGHRADAAVPRPTSTATPGAALVTVPTVGQINAEKAQMSVALTNLPTAYRFEHSSTVVAGSVIRETPAGGSRVAADTTVTLVVSIGPASIPGAQPCQAAHLKVQPGPLVSEMTSQRTGDWSFTNLAAPCVLDGYPALSALDKDGRVLGFSYTHSGDQMTTGAMPEPVYLPNGSAAWIRMNQSSCVIATADTSTTVTLSLPGGRGTLTIPASLNYCAQGESLTIAVSPFEPVSMLLFSS